MSVITSWTAVPNRLHILYHLLDSNEKGMDRDELKGFVVPQALQRRNNEEGTGSTLADEVLKEAKALGLIAEVQNIINIPQDRRGMDDSGLREYMEMTLLTPELAEQSGQALFANILAWFLAQDPAVPIAFSSNLRQQVEEECGTEAARILGNSSSFQNFIYWAQYLGYAWQMQVGRDRFVVPDPTSALEKLILTILNKPMESALPKLMAAIGKRNTVLEGGSVRELVEGLLPIEKRRQTGALSRTTSLAFMRLERKKVIKLEKRADAPVFRLASWPDETPVSHVILQIRSKP